LKKIFKRGFTLIELMIVIAIIAILASILVPNFSKSKDKAKLETCKSNIRSIVTAFTLYHNDNDSTFPPAGDITASHALVTGGYLKSVPVCPCNSTTSASYYTGFSNTYPGDYYAACRNYSAKWHSGFTATRPLMYFANGTLPKW